ncbi:prevent-host-death family protein [Tepidimonas alkaliphilus]|uniref:Antitoxin n=1 Tax=Tepidimonas alkaliphilus TaxID=2588942 RepID=A0A554WDM8_9BURK|nr:type II toxin-antitoxin system prevent-host-death family antitoxin [Tepidimonas alkaliphilus]TSE21691.1 prevent-host-death family protein [Tepidimonas alkaliphilus]
MKTLTASEANRHFSHLLRQVAEGEVVTIVSRGKTVATILPARPDHFERQRARQRLLARLHQQPASSARNWTRDELYEG